MEGAVRREIVDLLRCPASGGPLTLELEETEGEEIVSGWLVSEDRRQQYPVVSGIPRFVDPANYAESFGFQWNAFAKTQLDSISGLPISSDRFWKTTAWRADDLWGQWVLDVGCGAGRFAEVALRAGARVVAVDPSTAVDACYANLRGSGPIHVIQADCSTMPFGRGIFPFVYCLGVLQHTKDVPKAFTAIAEQVAPCGRLCVDVYEKSLKAFMHPKYWLRPLATQVDQGRLFHLLIRWVPCLRRLSSGLGRLPLIGRALRRMVPVANYEGVYRLRQDQLDEWALLDTFDWLTPTYDQPQTATALMRWFEGVGLVDVEIIRDGHLVGRGQKPA